eukprot:6709329-Alexandrium_andersonii.AAC.1
MNQALTTQGCKASGSGVVAGMACRVARTTDNILKRPVLRPPREARCSWIHVFRHAALMLT